MTLQQHRDLTQGASHLASSPVIKARRSPIIYSWDGMARIAVPCSDRPILRVLGPARDGPRAAPVGDTLSAGHEDREFQESEPSVAAGYSGVDPRADAPGAAPPGGLPEAGVPALARLSGSHGDLGQAICRNGGRRRAEKTGGLYRPRTACNPGLCRLQAA